MNTGMYPGMNTGMYPGMNTGAGGVPNQMYNSQMQMQQAAYQQQAVQNSMMYGYNNASSMYGMTNMGSSPYYGMGNTGMYGNNYGYGQYPSPLSITGQFQLPSVYLNAGLVP